MFARMFKPIPVGTIITASLKVPVLQARLMATVGRNIPANPANPRPVTHDRATFTIRNGPVFHGKSFGASSNVSGEAVFTTSLVGYPEVKKAKENNPLFGKTHTKD